MTALFPRNDEFLAFCKTEGYPSQYNDCLLAYLRDFTGNSTGSLPDLFPQWDGILSSVSAFSQDFSTESLDAKFTFTRASSGTRIRGSSSLAL